MARKASSNPPFGEGGAWVLLMAAGRGQRLGGERPKAFVRLGELPLLAESLRRLEECRWIDAIVVAVPAGWEEPAILVAEELSATKVVASITGGATRAESVRAAFAEVPEEALVVLVHDAARPLVTDEVIERVVTPLSEGWDGVVPAVPLSDTVKRIDGDAVVETVDRSTLVGAQTPQAFLVPTLRAALAGLGGSGPQGATDCAALVEAQGGRVRWVEGDRRLLKVTTPSDLELISSWL